MQISIWFWVIYVIAFIFSAWTGSPNWRGWAGGSLVFFVLVGLLGYAVFGSAIK